MANSWVEPDKAAIGAFLASSPELRTFVMTEAEQVRAVAAATAQDAQNGPGGTIDGYAEAGFTAEWDARTKRPRAIIKSNADGQTALAAHFNSQRKTGVAHLRAALYSIT